MTNKEKIISKYAIAFLFFRDPAIMTFTEPDIVSYIADGVKYDSKVKIEDDKVIWGRADGRWRDHEKDPKITFKIVRKYIKFTEKYYSGRTSSKKFLIKWNL